MFTASVSPSVSAAPPALHAPDGFMSMPVAGVGYAIAAVAIGYAVWRGNRELGERQIPLMGVMAAFIFAAQMLNFPVAGGTSGHLIGGALAAILLGPWAAMLVMTVVVAVQALVFQDGGLVVLGINVLNMAVVSCLVGYYVYTGLGFWVNSSTSRRLVSAFVAAWVSVEVSALLAAVELAISGTSPLLVVVPAMGGVHALIGIGEGLITAGAITFVAVTRRDLLALRTGGR